MNSGGERLSGKVAIVTGASRGLGRSLAASLVAAGARVGLLARPSADLNRLAGELRDEAIALPCDLGEPNEVRRAMASAVEHFGRLDILVNNAALCEPHLIEKTTDEQIEREVATNLMGAMYCVREAVPHLKSTGDGHIVNVSSESVALPFPYLSVYVATKAGLEGFSAALRTELRPHGVRVTVLRLGSVGETSVTDHWKEPIKSEYFAHVTRSGHLALVGAQAKPRSIAAALIDVLSFPADLSADLLEVRST